MTDLDPGKILSEILDDIVQPISREAAAVRAVSETPAVADDVGLAWVRDGQIFVRDPVNNGAPARLVPAGLKVSVNGVLVRKPVEVREQDVIEYEPRVDLIPPRLEVTTSPDNLLAFITITFGRRIEHVLEDQEPAAQLVLRTKPISFRIGQHTLNQVLSILAREGITHGIDVAGLKQFLDEQREGQFTVARGTPPGPPEDETVKILWVKEDTHSLREDRHGRIDFRELQPVPAVEKGALLARKVPGKPGTPGVGVRGETLVPAEPQPVKLVCGPGTAIAGDGTAVMATTSGQPAYEVRGRTYIFRVDPVYRIDGDVDFATGNVRFRGNVVVHGDVKPGMTVHATGNVVIGGDVDNARVGAYGSVKIVGSAINSRIVAGCTEGAAFLKVTGELEQVCKQMELLLCTVEKIYADQRLSVLDIGFGQLLQYLIDLRFSGLPSAVTGLLAHLRDIITVLPEDAQVNLGNLRYYFDGINLMWLQSVEQLRLLYHQLRFIAGCIRQDNTDDADLTLTYALNSTLTASGNVIITGQGCYATEIDAVGDVKVRGYVRGGYITSHRGVVILGEAGSEKGVKTLVRVAARQHVYIGRVYPEVRIFIGKQHFTVREAACYVHAYFDSQGCLKYNCNTPLNLTPRATQKSKSL